MVLLVAVMGKSSSSDQLPDKYYSHSMIFNTILYAYCVTRIIYSTATCINIRELIFANCGLYMIPVEF